MLLSSRCKMILWLNYVNYCYPCGSLINLILTNSWDLWLFIVSIFPELCYVIICSINYLLIIYIIKMDNIEFDNFRVSILTIIFYARDNVVHPNLTFNCPVWKDMFTINYLKNQYLRFSCDWFEVRHNIFDL